MVSIITVCLNSAATIEQTICSVLNQTYHDIEYIIIDGGSTDGTLEIINKYRSRISYFCSEEDEGIYNAINKGIWQAGGEIVGIINSDDWYAPDAVELAVRNMEESGCQMVYGDLAVVYGDGSVRINEQRSIKDIYVMMVFGHPTVFARRNVYQKYGGFDEAYGSASDYELMLRWYTNKVGMRYIPKTMAFFRKGGYSDYDLKKNMEESYDISKKYVEQYTGENKEYYMELIEKNKKKNDKKIQVNDGLKSLTDVERQQIQKEIKGGRNIVIFGTGDYGCWCYDVLSVLGIKVLFWVDNDESKQDKEMIGIPVFSAERIDVSMQKVIVGTKDYEKELVRQLENMGMERGDYMLISEIEQMLIRSW